jgi:hypothetical protein
VKPFDRNVSADAGSPGEAVSSESETIHQKSPPPAKIRLVDYWWNDYRTADIGGAAGVDWFTVAVAVTPRLELEPLFEFRNRELFQ